MATSFGLIESKGLVALIEAADVILKNSPVKILGVTRLQNGLIALAVTGEKEYINAAVESAVDAGRRVGEISAFTVIESPSREVIQIFSDLFLHSDESSNKLKDPLTSSAVKLNPINEPVNLDPTIKEKAIKFSSKKEKSKSALNVSNRSGEDKEKSEIKVDVIKKVVTEKPATAASSPKSEVPVHFEETDNEFSISTIERLRREALGLSNKKNSEEKNIHSDIIKSDDLPAHKNNVANVQVDFELINKMNVHKLRHYAREFPEFPIKGREISRANRDELVALFKKLVK